MNNKIKKSDILKNNPKDITKSNEKIDINEKTEDYISKINKLNQIKSDIKKNILEIKLREQAEIENIKKSAIKEIQNIKDKKLESFLKNLIPILDNLISINNTTSHLKKENNKITEGISLTLKLLLNTIKKFGLILENKTKIKFDPLLHQIEHDKKLNSSNTYYVSSIIKNGYIYKEKVLQKAIVKITNELL
ncbi:hypothetical protein XW81_00875 [Buchnera aphidicola (Schlechtendalia chinensis)]|uniref:Protein GrpE n=1 Tax=Buchnera aphidicola subsp. Schlechtendalia chinensis TaxID=118110 RepID=A0A172WDG6_BUCSC|nr:nucleotide exchange factor GrpE [Buchnera aphidicola]ANF16977.1 hypothetical protein XW81_00875 [Buchnera aphidicola (Schlechtendalia chinensis)]